ncbi:MAG: DNA-processing protein DprA [Lachnospiraceae bacterium]|nr:DNA-processing protein DprA [Lachnospiraceae bacterium]
MTREEIWYAVTSCKGITRQEIERILDVVGDPSALFGTNRESALDLLTERSALFSGRAAITPERAKLLRTQWDEGRIHEEMDDLERNGIRFVCRDSADYPERFRILKDPPFGLYVKGALPSENERTCGMVGARSCSEYGRAMATRFAKRLAEHHVQIISGMALGIDAVCSRAALDVNGRTFVVLGCGVDVIYPKENLSLYYEIQMNGGGIISEYPPGTKPLAWQFPHRNRLIAAFSDTLLVMEARKRSGTLTTVAHALDLGKDVFALPGRVTDPLSESCNLLIRDGAGLLTTPEELLSILGIGSMKKGKRTDPPIADAMAKRIFQALDMEPSSLEMICQKTGIDAQEAAGKMFFLTLEGWAKEVSPGYYVKAGE